MGFPPQGTVVVTPITSQEVWDYTTRVLTNLSTSRARSGEFEVGFPITPSTEPITGAGDMSEVNLTPTIPSGATLISIKLIAMITAVNLTATLNTIDLTVRVRKGTGDWSDPFSETGVIGLPATDRATVAWAGAMEVGDVVDTAGIQYGFLFRIAGATTLIRYTQGFVLIVKYRMD